MAEDLLRIESEADAWAILQRAVDGEFDDQPLPHVAFRGWPKFEIHIPETPINSSITPNMMAAFLELQDAIYRMHTLLKEDTIDLRGLSREERERLDIRVKVTGGSNNYVADAAPVVERLGAEVVGKMSGTQLVITIVALALIAAGTFGLKWWLEAKGEARKAELEAAGKKALSEQLEQHLQSVKEQREHETERFKLLLAAKSAQPVLADVESLTEPARQQLVKAVGEEKGGTVQNVPVTSFVATEVTAQKRRPGVDKVITGTFRVSRVDTTTAEGFRVVLTNTESGENITAALQDAFLSEEHEKIIQRAEWKKTPLVATISARQVGRRMTDAVVRDVRPAQSEGDTDH